MAYVSVKATATANSYQKTMKSMAQETKALASQWTATQAKAKAFGSQTDILKNKADALSDKIKLQKEIVKVTGDQYEKLSTKLTDQKSKHEELETKVKAAKKAYEESAKATGENSEETNKLKEELTKLETKLETSKNSINQTENALNKQAVAANNAEAKLSDMEGELKKTEDELKKVNKELKDQKLDAFGKACDDAGKKLEDFGKKMAVVSAGAAAFITGSAKAAVDFESAFAGVKKTCDEVYDQNGNLVYSYEKLETGIRNMAKNLPTTTTEISAVAASAGQLGVKTEDVLGFTQVMIDMGESTNLASEEAAVSLAKFANVTGLAKDQSEDASTKYSRLGSTIVALGNNFATTEADIANMAMNLASAGSQVGMSESDIIALAAALSSVGMEAQAGGSAFSKAMIQMQLAVESGNGATETLDKDMQAVGKTFVKLETAVNAGGRTLKKFAQQTGISEKELKAMYKTAVESEGALADWADVAGMSTSDFAKAFKEDATGALQAFIEGLSKCGGETDSAIKVLTEMGITEVRMRDALLRSANASEVFTSAIELGSQAWNENTALSEEAAKRYETVASQIAMLKNQVVDLGIGFGQQLLPHMQNGIDGLKNICEWFGNLDEETQGNILKTGLLVAAISPLAIVLGKVGQGVKGVVDGYKTMRDLVANVIAKVTAKTAATVADTAAQTAGTVATTAGTVATTASTAATTASTVATKALGLAMKAIPILAIVGLIAGLVTWLIDLYKNNEKFREAVNKVWNTVKTAFGNILGVFKNVGEVVGQVFGKTKEIIGNAMTAAKETVAEKLNNIKSAYEENGGGVKGVVAGAWEGIKGYYTAGFSFVDKMTGGKLTDIKNKFLNMDLGEVTKKVFGKVKEAAGTVLGKAKDAIAQKWDDIRVSYGEGGGGVAGILEVIFDQQADLFRNAFDLIQNITGISMEGIKEKVVSVIQNVRNIVVDFVHGITQKFSFGLQKAKEIVSNVFHTIGNIIKFSIMLIKEIINAAFLIITLPFRFIWENCKHIIIAAWNAIKEKVQVAVNVVRGVISTAMIAVKTVIETVWNAIKEKVLSALNFVKTTITAAMAVIKNIIETVWNAIKLILQPIVEAIYTVIATTWEAIKAYITTVINIITSVLTVAWNTIKTVVTTIVEAIRSAVTTAWNVIMTVTTAVWGAINAFITTAFNTIYSVVTSVLNRVKTVVSIIWTAVKEIIEKNVDTAKTVVSNTFNTIKSTVSSAIEATKKKVTDVFEAIKKAIETPINKAKDTVSAAIDAIKDKFNFEWSFPKLKMPHFKIEGSFSLDPPSVPHLGVEWYKTGGIMTNPTAFGIHGNKVMMGGEAGAEAILPLAEFYKKLEEILERKLSALNGVDCNIYVQADNADIIKKMDELARRIETAEKRKIQLTIVPDKQNIYKVVVEENNKKIEMTGKTELIPTYQ